MRRVLLRYPFSTAFIILTVVFSTGLLLASLSGVVSWGEPLSNESSPFEVLSPSVRWKPHPMPDFSLINQDGRQIGLPALRGKVVFVNFIYTRCLDVCPVVTRHLKQLQEKLGARMGKDVLFLSISVDPQHDSPQVLRQFGKRHQVDFGSWLMLTGSKQEIDNVQRGLGVAAGKTVEQADGLDTQHTTAIYVVDRNGAVTEKIPFPALVLSGLATVERYLQKHGS